MCKIIQETKTLKINMTQILWHMFYNWYVPEKETRTVIILYLVFSFRTFH